MKFVCRELCIFSTLIMNAYIAFAPVSRPKDL